MQSNTAVGRVGGTRHPRWPAHPQVPCTRMVANKTHTTTTSQSPTYTCWYAFESSQHALFISTTVYQRSLCIFWKKRCESIMPLLHAMTKGHLVYKTMQNRQFISQYCEQVYHQTVLCTVPYYIDLPHITASLLTEYNVYSHIACTRSTILMCSQCLKSWKYTTTTAMYFMLTCITQMRFKCIKRTECIRTIRAIKLLYRIS
jgi:hypothetical protein